MGKDRSLFRTLRGPWCGNKVLKCGLLRLVCTDTLRHCMGLQHGRRKAVQFCESSAARRTVFCFGCWRRHMAWRFQPMAHRSEEVPLALILRLQPVLPTDEHLEDGVAQ
eukprot:26393-Chlamydomonas_euryale.AAC.1